MRTTLIGFFLYILTTAGYAYDVPFFSPVAENHPQLAEQILTIPHIYVDFSPGYFSDVQFKLMENNQWELLTATSSLQGVKSVTYGRYAGECAGYCFSSVIVTENTIMYKKGGGQDVIPEITMRTLNKQEDWDNLIQLIDYPLFESLPDVIGYPDGADQGGEFVAIQFDEKRKRIDFNYSIDSKTDLLTQALQTLYQEQQDLFEKNTR